FTPYAFCVALVVSATTAIILSVESSIRTRRVAGSFTSTRPPGSARTADSAPKGPDEERAGPSRRIGGRCATATDAYTNEAMKTAAQLTFRARRAVGAIMIPHRQTLRPSCCLRSRSEFRAGNAY